MSAFLFTSISKWSNLFLMEFMLIWPITSRGLEQNLKINYWRLRINGGGRGGVVEGRGGKSKDHFSRITNFTAVHVFRRIPSLMSSQFSPLHLCMCVYVCVYMCAYVFICVYVLVRVCMCICLLSDCPPVFHALRI